MKDFLCYVERLSKGKSQVPKRVDLCNPPHISATELSWNHEVSKTGIRIHSKVLTLYYMINLKSMNSINTFSDDFEHILRTYGSGKTTFLIEIAQKYNVLKKCVQNGLFRLFLIPFSSKQCLFPTPRSSETLQNYLQRSLSNSATSN